VSPRILVVDDEPLIAEALQAFLEDEGMEVDCVGSAEAALARVHAGGRYDVCIMDIRLPGADGNVGIRMLHRVCPHLHFLIHTGSADYTVPDDLRSFGLGDEHLFRKPLRDMRLIADRVRALAGD
jgi:two-component system, OmpR family, response regulator